MLSPGDVQQADAILAGDDQKGQDLVDALTVLPVAAAKLTPALHKRLASLFPALSLATRSGFAVVRYAVAKSFATLCDINPTEGLRHVVESVVPVLGDPLNVDNRRGAIELISHLVELLDVKILPYVIFLVVPVLGRMSDPDDEVRLVATNTFASLVKLVPLEVSVFRRPFVGVAVSDRALLPAGRPARPAWLLGRAARQARNGARVPHAAARR